MTNEFILRIIETLILPFLFSVSFYVFSAGMERRYKEASFMLEQRRLELEAEAGIRRDLIALINTYKEHIELQDEKIKEQEVRIRELESSEESLKTRITHLERILHENGIYHR